LIHVVTASYDDDEAIEIPFAMSNPSPIGSFVPLQKKVIKPTQEEIESNPRARSAKLRVYKRTEMPPVHPLS
jgi:16S rRNA C1402 N4-methylase RsmH